mmetsp:Transcript_46663/g.113697  ORF Transcript_46663/g.113697 Transcript_46663/m.113697 type:complete len:172 (-) Transcript_46663:155-670(-)
MTIKLQQDNAKAHRGVQDEDPFFRAARARNGLNIVIKDQVARSPDTNVLDLGYFRAIEALQQKQRQRTIQELVDRVKESFASLHRETLEKVFLSHQSVCGEIILHEGTNEFKIPHLNKESMKDDNGRLPSSIPLTEEVKAKAQYLRPHMCEVNPMEGAPPPGPGIDQPTAV